MLKTAQTYLAARKIFSLPSSSRSLLHSRLEITSFSLPRSFAKNYDKRILLEPEDVTYRADDSQFLGGPSFRDEPYIKPTDDEMVELDRVKLEDEIAQSVISKVDPNAQPFRQVLHDSDDGGRFTNVEKIPDLEERWPWVERLLSRPLLERPIEADSRIIPPLPTTLPDLPYFVRRTRSRLFPLYRKYEIVNRNHKTYWRNRWDGLFNKYHADILDNLDEIKWINNEKTITLTEVNQIDGDLWRFEEDARTYLEQVHRDKLESSGERILTGVNELRGFVQFKGDYVDDLYRFLVEKGF